MNALGKKWSVAKDARLKFDRLAEATRESWRRREESTTHHSRLSLPSVNQEQQLPVDNDGAGTGMADQDFGLLFDPTELVTDELGDMSGWFDLEWFETFGVEGLGGASI